MSKDTRDNNLKWFLDNQILNKTILWMMHSPEEGWTIVRLKWWKRITKHWNEDNWSKILNSSKFKQKCIRKLCSFNLTTVNLFSKINMPFFSPLFIFKFNNEKNLNIDLLTCLVAIYYQISSTNQLLSIFQISFKAIFENCDMLRIRTIT